MYKLTGELFMKSCIIKTTEADLPVSANRLASGTWIKAAAWQVRSELAGALWFGMTEHTEEHCDEHGGADSANQPVGDEMYVDKLSGDPFNPKPKTSMAGRTGENY